VICFIFSGCSAYLVIVDFYCNGLLGFLLEKIINHTPMKEHKSGRGIVSKVQQKLLHENDVF
jgi:hypothetical protein